MVFKIKSVSKFVLLFLLLITAKSYGRGVQEYVSTSFNNGDFKLVWENFIADVYVSNDENVAVLHCANDFIEDVERVTGKKPKLKHTTKGLSRHAIIVGTLGQSKVIQDLVKAGKIDVRKVEEKWETFLIQVVSNPLPGIDKGLVIVGSDRRGAIYGMYDVSEKMGVSPWYWFADVHPKKQTALVIKNGTYREGPPSVKYRGIFINDEMWSLTPWARKTFAHHEPEGLGPTTYAKICELMARLRLNYLWPGMHDWPFKVPYKAFNQFEENKVIADEHAIVMGASHIEPMLRCNMPGAEWDEEYPGEPWDYRTNKEHIYEYWEKRVKENGKYENIWPLGKRGKNDHRGKDVNLTTLPVIISDQRKMLSDWVNSDVTKIPQTLTFYEEIREIYNQGLKVPEDITLIWTDYNGGTIKQLPNKEEQKRPGGNGVYSHFQYRGGVTYQWLDAQPVARTWQQLHMAYENGVDRIWIVNAGDIKPHEYSIDYFSRLAWDIKPWNNSNAREFLLQWAERDFGKEYAASIADILEKHLELGYALRPEQVCEVDKENIFSMVHYNDELQRRIDDYDELMKQTDDVYSQLPIELKDAFFEMVVYNVKCAALHNKKVLYAYKSYFYGKQKRASAADYADLAKKAASDIDALMQHYNTGLLTVKDKWNHFASYPEKADPESHYNKIWEIPETSTYNGKGEATLHVAMEGNGDTLAGLSVFDKNKRFIDLFNTGIGTVKWKAKFDDWIKLSETSGTFEKEKRIWVTINWNKAPKGENLTSVIHFEGSGKSCEVPVYIFNPLSPKPNQTNGFVESHGYVSMEAEHYSRKVDKGEVGWEIINGLGRSGNSVTVLPSIIPCQTEIDQESIQKNSPALEYDMFLFSTGEISVSIYALPTFPLDGKNNLRIAVAVDNQQPVVIPAKQDGKSAISQINRIMFHGNLQNPNRGQHTLKVWMLDPGIVLDKILLKTGDELKQSYLGPPESYYN